MESIRAFIAIELPEAIKSALVTVQNDLKGGKQTPVKWVAPDSIHLTLKFLGNVAPETIPAITQAISGIAMGLTPFSLELGEPGAFPNTRNPRVLWIGLRGDIDILSILQKKMERALVPLGFPQEKKAFSPHLTLGRVRENVYPEDRRHLGELIASLKSGPALSFSVDSLNLMRSTLTPQGAIYSRLHSAPLRSG